MARPVLYKKIADRAERILQSGGHSLSPSEVERAKRKQRNWNSPLQIRVLPGEEETYFISMSDVCKFLSVGREAARKYLDLYKFFYVVGPKGRLLIPRDLFFKHLIYLIMEARRKPRKDDNGRLPARLKPLPTAPQPASPTGARVTSPQPQPTGARVAEIADGGPGGPGGQAPASGAEAKPQTSVLPTDQIQRPREPKSEERKNENNDKTRRGLSGA